MEWVFDLPLITKTSSCPQREKKAREEENISKRQMENEKDKMLEILREMFKVITEQTGKNQTSDSQITQIMYSVCVSVIDRMCSVCSPPAFLLFGRLYVDVSGRRAAVHHAGGGVRERVLAHQVLLSDGLRGTGCYSGCVRCRGLP